MKRLITSRTETFAASNAIKVSSKSLICCATRISTVSLETSSAISAWSSTKQNDAWKCTNRFILIPPIDPLNVKFVKKDFYHRRSLSNTPTFIPTRDLIYASTALEILQTILISWSTLSGDIKSITALANRWLKYRTMSLIRKRRKQSN